MTFLSLSFFYCKIGVIICDPCPRQRAVRPQREDTCALQTLKHCTDVSGDTYHSLIFSCLLLSKTGDFLTIDLQVSLQLVGMAEWRETSVNGEPGPLLTGEINSGTSMCVGGRHRECFPHLLGALQLLPRAHGAGGGGRMAGIFFLDIKER